MTKRFLDPKDIPQSLWDDDKLLLIPQPLRDAYHKILKTRGLLEDAHEVRSEGDIGGKSKDKTAWHFAHRFSGSCARVELAVLDPKDELGDASDYFLRAFSGGRVRLLDIPCGSGAASATLLMVVAELRRQNIIPREPLEVFLTGGDKSDVARDNACLIFNELRQPLYNQGIFVDMSFLPWDMLDPESTTNLLDKWLTNSPDCSKSFLLIANVSNFLGGDGNIRKAKERLGEVFRWVGMRKSTVVWIEPQTKRARNMLSRKAFKEIFDLLTGWIRKPTETSEQPTSEAKFAHPLCSDSHSLVRLLLVQLERSTL